MAQNNPALFDALMAGGCGGALERWITSSNSNDYGSLVDAVEAFATAVDQAIPTIGGDGPSISQINLLQSLAQGIVAGRNLASIDSDTFADIAAAIAAVFAEAEPRLNNVPVISGGGGGGSDQLPNIRWLYSRTDVAPEEQDGSYSKPFSSATDCIAALAAQEALHGAGSYIMMVWPGDYLADGLLTWTPTDPSSPLVISNAAGIEYEFAEPALAKFDSIHVGSADLYLSGVIVQGENGIVVDNGNIDLQGCQVWFKCETALALWVKESMLIGSATVSGGTQVNNSTLQGGSIAQADGTTISMTATKWLGTDITYPTADPSNNIFVDSMTEWWFGETSPDITNGIKTVMV